MDEQYTKRKTKRRLAYFMAVIGCLFLLLLVMVLGFTLYSWWIKMAGPAKKIATVNGEAIAIDETVFTAAEVEALLAEHEKNSELKGMAGVLENIQTNLEAGVAVSETLRPLYPDKLVVVSGGRYHFVPIRDDLQHNDYYPDHMLETANGEVQYTHDGQVISHKGIDVSKFQGSIDWELVAADGVEFAFIRVGNRGYGSNGTLLEDSGFEDNIVGASLAGVKVGVYFYTQAINEEELIEEANLVLGKIQDYQIDCPVVIDVEKVSGSAGRMDAISVEQRTALVKLFCEIVAEAGYQPMIYHNMEMGVLLLNLEELEQYDKWLAYYNRDMYYPYAYSVWQYSEKGSVQGIQGKVDMNISFAPIWKE